MSDNGLEMENLERGEHITQAVRKISTRSTGKPARALHKLIDNHDGEDIYPENELP
jgi:hypothetical protein